MACSEVNMVPKVYKLNTVIASNFAMCPLNDRIGDDTNTGPGFGRCRYQLLLLQNKSIPVCE